MATSKTLTPTNVTISIPAFSDRMDQRLNSNCIDKEADAINALNSKIANIVVVEDKTITFESNGEGDISKSGYVPISVVEYGVWRGFSIRYFAFVNDHAVIKADDYAGLTKTLRIVYVRINN